MPLFTDDVPERIHVTVAALYLLEEWPRDWTKDVSLVDRLMRTYPSADLAAEAVHFVTWMEGWREKHPRKEVNHRSRFVNWVKNSRRFEKRKPKPPASKDAHRPTGVEGW